MPWSNEKVTRYSRVLKKEDKIFVAGHKGLVGSAIIRQLRSKGYENLVVRDRSSLDLMDQAAVKSFLSSETPDAIVMAAAKVGGIGANSTYPADFIGLNLVMECNLMWGAHEVGIDHFCFLGSSCIYPRETPQPIPEDALLTGKPEPTNAPYAVAKIAGLVLADSISKQYGRQYFTCMPPNVYGPGDNYDLQTSHVLPALIRKFHEAKLAGNAPVTCWGTGSPRREFLFSDDVADAIIFLMEQDSVPNMVNIGVGTSISIKELAETVQKVVGHSGTIEWDTTKPDGFPEKTNDVSRLFGMGWRPKYDLESGIRAAYEAYQATLVSH
ncbi:MAG: GDP-L-fucose synthase [Armatimonadetes bacterium]|nr:GDP-L-fucose synthase [Armatimonadota bacterium]